MNMTMKQLVGLASVLILSGCSFMSPVKTGPDTGYVINTIPDHVVKTRQRSQVLLVMNPDTNPVFNTTRMAFTMHPYQISYYTQSHWIQAPSDMLAPLLMQTLQNTNHFKTVIAPPFAGQYDYALRTQIKTLLIDYTHKIPVLQLNLQVQLVGASSGRLLASRAFTTSVPLPSKSPYGAVVAANCATARLLAEIASWSVSKTR